MFPRGGSKDGGCHTFVANPAPRNRIHNGLSGSAGGDPLRRCDRGASGRTPTATCRRGVSWSSFSTVGTAQDKFGQLIADHFAPWLKERGFRRRDTTFRRRRDAAWQIVNFQRSQASDARRVRFTINLGVALDVLHDDPRWRSRGWPLEYECDFRQRIGLLHEGRDRWWTVRPLRPARGTVEDVIAALEPGLRWLDAHADPRSVLADALRDPAAVHFMNVPPLVALARKIGDEGQVEAAEAEAARRAKRKESI